MSTSADFHFDVFLSHSAKDKGVVRVLAERLRADGLRVWLDEWAIKPGDSIPAKIEEGLENSRVLVLCMSAQAFGSEWAQLEAGTFRFRDPLNKQRRFIPMRLDLAPIKGSLSQFLYISCLPDEHEQAYAKLFEACAPPVKPGLKEADIPRQSASANFSELPVDSNSRIRAFAFSPDGYRVLIGATSNIELWDLQARTRLQVLEGDFGEVRSLVFSVDQRRALSGSADGNVRLWNLQTGECLRVLSGHTADVLSLWGLPNLRRALSGAADSDNTLRLWNVDTGRCLQVFSGHIGPIWSVAWSVEQDNLLSGSGDMTVRQWNVATGQCLRVLEGHIGRVFAVAMSADRRFALSGSADHTARLWDLKTGDCIRVLKGHTNGIRSVAWSADDRRVLTGSWDSTVRLWDTESGRCLRILEGHTSEVRSVAWIANQNRALSADQDGGIRTWNLSKTARRDRAPTITSVSTAPSYVQYTNAKVLLVGETGAGKTGLSKVLAGQPWQLSDSTVGAWATQWKLPVAPIDGVEREIWLWDFGGQADQRLIHQLYMDDAALAALVFDGQKDDVFETLSQWDRDLARVSSKALSKLLVVGRMDAGGLRVSRSQVKAFAKERGFAGVFETSAKIGTGCGELKQAILNNINWASIPWRSSPVLFKRLKEEIIRLRDEGRVLLRFNELRETLQLRLPAEVARFTDDELKAVIGLLSGPAIVWELKFGSWVLLQPERINAYAQAVIQTMREDKHERGCIAEEQMLNGNLTYQSAMPRIKRDDERFVLLAMYQMLVERGLCLRENTDQGSLLIFPSYYRRERPELVDHPAVQVSYRFNGFIDDLYARLVVRLHHTKSFEQDQLWNYAADFRTLTSKQLGMKLIRRAEGSGELEVYFDPVIPMQERIIFSKYVHEHLLQYAKDVVRLRHYVCSHCFTPVGNREVAMKRLDGWLNSRPASVDVTNRTKTRIGRTDYPTIVCSECEKRVPLWDEMEQCFASPEIQKQVRDLQEQASIVLDNESKERALVGDVISTVALAGQICREKNVSDHGIDMEVEFKSEAGEATGQMVYLQLKSGDSYLKIRKSDGAEIFRIEKPRHAEYWRVQTFPVLLVVRDSIGEIRWMDVRSYLSRESDNGKRPVKQIVFQSERFDVMSVRRWREAALNKQVAIAGIAMSGLPKG